MCGAEQQLKIFGYKFVGINNCSRSDGQRIVFEELWLKNVNTKWWTIKSGYKNEGHIIVDNDYSIFMDVI